MDSPAVTLVSAAAKREELAATKSKDSAGRVRIVPRPRIFQLQKNISKEVISAEKVPFKLRRESYDDLLFSGIGEGGCSALSQWLRAHGYCLHILYTDTGNNDIIDFVQLGFYEDRGYEAEEAGVMVEKNDLFPPYYF